MCSTALDTRIEDLDFVIARVAIHRGTCTARGIGAAVSSWSGSKRDCAQVQGF